jgi:hypothetical protein
MSNWIPDSELKLVALCTKWIHTLRSEEVRTVCRWDKDLCTDAISKIEPFESAHKAYQAADTSENRAAKNETKRVAVSAMRAFATSSMRHNPYMTDAYRLVMGLNKPDTTPTAHLRPTSRPNIIAERTANYYEHRVKALNAENGKATKPADAYGVRFVWQAGGERPATGASIINGKFSRRPVITIAYDETERGKTAYYASCYENAKGEAGPWSPVEEAYIG